RRRGPPHPRRRDRQRGRQARVCAIRRACDNRSRKHSRAGGPDAVTPRPAPGAERVVAVLNFLAAHPDESFTLSELARRLDLNKATCHALLMSLTEAGYVLRHPTRMTYMLGPALVAVGSAAQGQFQAVDFAREEMRALAEETSLECIASTVVGDEIVILSRSGAPLPFGTTVALGREDYFLIEVEPEAPYKVNTMGAPVFGPTGRVELGLFLVGFRGVLKGEDVMEHGERLSQATRNVTKAIHGVEPARA